MSAWNYLAVAGIVFAVNLLPAFGPPTWAVLVFFRLNWDVAAVPLVAIGALSAASAARHSLGSILKVPSPRRSGSPSRS